MPAQTSDFARTSAGCSTSGASDTFATAPAPTQTAPQNPEAVTKGGIRRLIYTTTPADAGTTVEHILRAQVGASAAAIKRAKAVGADRVPFVEFGFENFYPNTVAVKDFQKAQLTAPHDYEFATDESAPLIAGITLDGARCRTNARVSAGQRVTLLIDDFHLGTFAPSILPESGPIDIVYEDDDICVVNKQPHISMYPGARHDFGTLTNYLMAHMQSRGQRVNPHPVHRLDKDTSGLVVFAKNSFAHDQLQNQLHTGNFQRTYLALCCGHFAPGAAAGTVDAPIKRTGHNPGTFGIAPDGKRAVTHYQVLSQHKSVNAALQYAECVTSSTTPTSDTFATSTSAESVEYSLVKLQLETGRTHQIRIHMASIGHPLLGDATYGTPSALIDRTALHSWQLTITHPTSRQPLHLEVPPPWEL